MNDERGWLTESQAVEYENALTAKANLTAVLERHEAELEEWDRLRKFEADQHEAKSWWRKLVTTSPADELFGRRALWRSISHRHASEIDCALQDMRKAGVLHVRHK